MDRNYFFERNLLSLSAHNPALCSQLSVTETTKGRYKFLNARTGELIPALSDSSGCAHPLHSTVDPVREARRLVSTLQDENGRISDGFIVFLGLGGGFAPELLLGNSEISHVLVIEYDINGIAELLCSREYITLLGDSRFTLLIDPAAAVIESTILDLYRPALAGGIRTLLLRARVDLDKHNFTAASEAIQHALEKVSSDYSVQAYFGKRWFTNIIRNLNIAEQQNRSAAPIREAAICAAGPSLDDQISRLIEHREHSSGLFIISADTALPALLQQGIRPDAVVSIDCQHISYYHFMGVLCKSIPLFLDIASPPLLAGFSDLPFFFSGGHPLAAYISQEWRPLPLLDTSGGNVSYACLSLAENLGARHITVYGADFSYPGGRVYARGSYIYPYFERRQERRTPLESLLSEFLFRAPFLPSDQEETAHKKPIPYETATMRMYRRRFEQKASAIDAQVTIVEGKGMPVNLGSRPVTRQSDSRNRVFNLFAPGKILMHAERFLEQYSHAISALPPINKTINANTWLRNLDTSQKRIFITLLPQAATLKRCQSEFSTAELIEAVKRVSIEEIDRVLAGNMG